jgi:hypothetical protein
MPATPLTLMVGRYRADSGMSAKLESEPAPVARRTPRTSGIANRAGDSAAVEVFR